LKEKAKVREMRKNSLEKLDDTQWREQRLPNLSTALS
jgi:hypothetical protein